MGPVHRLVLAIQYGIKCSTNVHETVGLKSIFKDKNTGAIFKGKNLRFEPGPYYQCLTLINIPEYSRCTGPVRIVTGINISVN